MRVLALILAASLAAPVSVAAQSPAGHSPLGAPSWDKFVPPPPSASPTNDEIRYSMEIFTKTEAALAGAAEGCRAETGSGIGQQIKACTAAILDDWPRLTGTADVAGLDPGFRSKLDATWVTVMSIAANYQIDKHPFKCDEVMAAARKAAVFSVCHIKPEEKGRAPAPPSEHGFQLQ